MTIVASILLGTGLGFAAGYPFGAGVYVALAGAAAGIVLGFYVVYVRFIR